MQLFMKLKEYPVDESTTHVAVTPSPAFMDDLMHQLKRMMPDAVSFTLDISVRATYTLPIAAQYKQEQD